MMELKKILDNDIKFKTSIDVDHKHLNKIIAANRNSLKLINNWIDEDAFKNSCYNYGVPDHIKIHLNKGISNNPTYTDYMLLIAEKHFATLNYLEIGVSVGKNFFQILNNFSHSSLTGFDIEEINPILEREFDLLSSTQWRTLKKSIKKNKSSLSNYSYQTNTVKYLSADIWDINSWKKLKGQKYNMIFSDALHSSEAIKFEFKMISRLNLLSDQFVMVWDDLGEEMQKSFFDIIKEYEKLYKIKEIYLLNLNGWIGDYEHAHKIGIVSNFNF
jgi:hypothetical protein